jgi:transcriptional regulator with XRE-family HTH domain
MTFGEYIKQKRLARGYTLREFCKTIGYDASNWSKIERGRLKVPLSYLPKISELLEISKEEYNEMEDLAHISQGIIPKPLTEEEIVQHLPLFCKALRCPGKAEKLIKLLEENL